MPASEAKIAANRRNAARSTGPRTTEGKRRSSGNALKHGLCSAVVLHPDDPPATGSPRTLDAWLAGQAALAASKVERCQAMERAIRQRVVDRASITWHDDRKFEATLLGSGLAARPEEVAARLRQTYHGCEWLITRWAMLAHAADTLGCWTPEQVRLAFDLMGTPAEFRQGHPPGTWIDFSGKLHEPTPGPAAVARRIIAELQTRLEALRPLDEAARERAQADLADDDPELKRLRRYEVELHRRMKWALEQIGQAPRPDESGPAPKGEEKLENEPVTESIEARPMPEPADSSAPLSRTERRLIRAESRREAKRRKLDQLRA